MFIRIAARFSGWLIAASMNSNFCGANVHVRTFLLLLLTIVRVGFQCFIQLCTASNAAFTTITTEKRNIRELAFLRLVCMMSAVVVAVVVEV